jgi:hypothetical protein
MGLVLAYSSNVTQAAVRFGLGFTLTGFPADWLYRQDPIG